MNLLQPPADWARAERTAYYFGLFFVVVFVVAFVLEYFVSY